MQYRDSPKNLRQIGEELKAQYLLEGGVQRVEDTVRINVQLIDAHADEHVWTGTYDRELSIENLLSVQSEIAQRVAASLNATVTLEEQRRIEAAPTGNIEAYEHYLRGMVNWPWGNWDARVELFDRAVTLDPSFLLPYARLELIHCHRYWVGIDHSEQGLALCENAVNRALSIDPDHPESRAARGHYLMYIHSDSERALRDFEVAQLGGVDTRHLTALAEWSLGNVERAATILTELCDIYDPRNGNVCETACDVYLQLRDYSEAERYCDRAIALVPTNIDPAVLKAQVVIRRDGDIDRARQLLHAIPGVVGDTSAYPASYYMTEWILLELLARKYEQALEMLASSPPMLYQSQYRYVPKSLLYAKVYALMDSMHVARVFYDSARAFLEVELATQPDDARVRSALGIAYAGVGRRDSAVSHGTRAVELSMSTRGMKSRAVAALAEIYAIVNEHGAAIDQLEYLMSVPGETSVSVLRLDPIWDPLRDHPRFQALLDKYE
jgi:serine/threonine-protein kinase